MLTYFGIFLLVYLAIWLDRKWGHGGISAANQLARCDDLVANNCNRGRWQIVWGEKKAADEAAFSGPREIRTLDLLNAIETRSQLRYGPLFCSILLFSMALPIPPGRGLRALWTLVLLYA